MDLEQTPEREVTYEHARHIGTTYLWVRLYRENSSQK